MSRRWRPVARFMAALGLAGAVTFTGLPGVPAEHAFAAPAETATLRPGTGKRCGTKHLGRTHGTTPSNSGFPTAAGTRTSLRSDDTSYRDTDVRHLGGGLAHTGSDVPIGVIVGVAAAVIAAGAGLVWWMGRRGGTG